MSSVYAFSSAAACRDRNKNCKVMNVEVDRLLILSDGVCLQLIYSDKIAINCKAAGYHFVVVVMTIFGPHSFQAAAAVACARGVAI